MNCYIIVEGTIDKVVLESVLLPSFIRENRLEILDGGGLSGADSLARTLLVTRQEPVVLLVDADSNQARAIAEKRVILQESLGETAPAANYRVLLAEPALEAIFFQDENLLRKYIPTLTTENFIRGQYTPNRILKELLGDDYPMRFLERITEEDLQTWRRAGIIQELEAAVTKLYGAKSARRNAA